MLQGTNLTSNEPLTLLPVKVLLRIVPKASQRAKASQRQLAPTQLRKAWLGALAEMERIAQLASITICPLATKHLEGEPVQNAGMFASRLDVSVSINTKRLMLQRCLLPSLLKGISSHK